MKASAIYYVVSLNNVAVDAVGSPGPLYLTYSGKNPEAPYSGTTSKREEAFLFGTSELALVEARKVSHEFKVWRVFTETELVVDFGTRSTP